MPNNICLFGCNKEKKLSVFSIPKNNDVRSEWQSSLNVTLEDSDVICEHHFYPSDIKRTNDMVDKLGNIVCSVPLLRPRLKCNAIPHVNSTRKKLKFSKDPTNEVEKLLIQPLLDHSYSTTQSISEYKISNNSDSIFIDLDTAEICLENVQSELSTLKYQKQVQDISFNDLNTLDLYLPPNWHKYFAHDKKYFGVSEIIFEKKGKIINSFIRKNVIVSQSLNITCNILGKDIRLDKLNNFDNKIESQDNFNKLIKEIALLKICKGLDVISTKKYDSFFYHNDNILFDTMQVKRHTECTVLISNGSHCCYCARTIRKIYQRKIRSSSLPKRTLLKTTPKSKKTLELLQKRNDFYRKKKNRFESKVNFLKKKIHQLQCEYTNMSQQIISQKLTELNCPTYQKTIIQEIFAAAKVSSSNGRRYSEEWLLLCMLFHIRSPSGYNFCLKNNILPLPNVSTIRRYLSLIDTTCGFDKTFFALFKKHLEKKNTMQKHGIILVDEISVRESLTVCSKNLTYKGLVDFGDDYKANNISEKATSGLVFMFQPLADTYSQPVAVFASRGPVVGTELAKLMLKCIILVEQARAMVHGIVSDGAQTNRKMWSELGVSGQLNSFKNWFQHPLDEKRKIYAFSDTPHLFKNVRNKLYNDKILKINDQYINWNHIKSLYEKDSQLPGNLRVCPKLSRNHVNLSVSDKMRVRLATQVLSNSVANGLMFYKQYNVPGLSNCEPTADFCRKFYDCFDALNRKFGAEGLRVNGKDYQYLQSFLIWLNEWEQQLTAGLIKKTEFLTDSTVCGLRVTIQSTLDLSTYLNSCWNFKYLLTGKINQDKLEMFFGTIRQAAGQNDHPSTPNFLQLYKLLSTYSILKPPKSGNCTIDDDAPLKPIISISDLKDIYQTAKINEIENLKEKINKIIEEKEWEISDIVEHDYSKPEVVDCLIYYLTGYLSKQLLKYINGCETCKSAFCTPLVYSQQLSASLVNLKTKGKLIHPNIYFFNFIKKIELSFIKNCSFTDVFERIISDIIEEKSICFPCSTHGQDIISFAVTYYVRMRMRQFTYQENKKKKPENRNKKKIAKFSKT